ncbi:MAG: translation initiation factor IF-2 [Candidatus Thalassarchaeaceae archaeon]|nr:translation initiation factor IF-2 [Candidatus Thalassarchaeaceae archaeon]
MANKNRRQPIVAVLGHVDHGKTSVLDYVRSLGKERQSSVMAREAGGITQHIGATEVPAKLLNELCSPLMGGKEFLSPGLLFIDTPGHHSFSTLRTRGGSLADIAILVIDIMEGCQPQTLESIRILKQAKTPFVVCANKVDRIHGWKSVHGRSVADAMKDQDAHAQGLFEQKFWNMVGQFGEHGFNLDMYNRISDFTQNIALVPCSAKDGEGLQDLLAVTIGLAERFLEEQLSDVEGATEGTVLEMKEERGLGKTLDVILYRGEIKKGDEIIIATDTGARITRVRGLFRPRGMSEMRDAGDRWDAIDHVEAAAGLKLAAPDLDGVLAGTTLHVITEESKDEALLTAESESKISIDLDDEGIVIKSDTLGGLEALAFELRNLETPIPIRNAGIGPVNKKDLRSAENSSEPLNQAILAFNTDIQGETEEELSKESCEVVHIGSDVIYHILERFAEWRDERKNQIEEEKREKIVYPGKLLILRDHIFRRSGPAVVGVRILGGRLHVGQRLLKPDGSRIGQVKSIRTGDSSHKEAKQGEEVAVAIDGATVGRGIDEEDILLVDVPASHARRLRKLEMTSAEEEILEELTALHRKDDHFWGR